MEPKNKSGFNIGTQNAKTIINVAGDNMDPKLYKSIKALEAQIKKENAAYRTGDPIVSDAEYDKHVEELEKISPESPTLKKIGLHISDQDARKQKLPIIMASLNKEKTAEGLKRWLRLKNISENEPLIITPKLDGNSVCVDERKNNIIYNIQAWTRGDGEFGQNCTNHIYLTDGFKKAMLVQRSYITYGEVIMRNDRFEKHKNTRVERGIVVPYKHPRNLVAGKITDLVPDEKIVSDFDYIRYGLSGNGVEDIDKEKQLSILNELNTVKIQYEKTTGAELTDKLLNDLYKKWNTDYKIDGLVIEVNDADVRKRLGRETHTNNPCYARAYKGKDLAEVGETKVLRINKQISKFGYFSPVCSIEPIELDGGTISNAFAHNFKFVNGYHLHVGSTIKIKRSGQIIPYILEVDGIEVEKDKDENFIYPYNGPYTTLADCEYCGGEITWNDNEVEIMCNNVECPGSQLQRIIAFFEIMECKDVSDGVLTDLYERGYKTIKSILELKSEDMQVWDGWKERKANIVYNSIQSKIKNIPLEKLQHASGCFKGLGSRKLVLLKHFKTKPNMSEIIAIPGFKEKGAKMYLDGIDKFNEFAKNITGVTIEEESKPVEIKGRFCENWSVVFTGIRSAEMEAKIMSQGGKILSGVSKNASHLIVKEKGSGSSKEEKAADLGLTIMTIEELKNILK